MGNLLLQPPQPVHLQQQGSLQSMYGDSRSEWRPQVYLSTFSGESCTFGQSSVVSGWTAAVTSQLTGSQAVYFVPFFSVDPATFSSYSSLISGAMNWNAGWPISLTASNYASLAGTVSNIDGTTTDSQYLSGLSSFGGSYLPTVSPWFYTHYSPSTYNKNVSSLEGLCAD